MYLACMLIVSVRSDLWVCLNGLYIEFLLHGRCFKFSPSGTSEAPYIPLCGQHNWCWVVYWGFVRREWQVPSSGLVGIEAPRSSFTIALYFLFMERILSPPTIVFEQVLIIIWTYSVDAMDAGYKSCRKYPKGVIETENHWVFEHMFVTTHNVFVNNGIAHTNTMSTNIKA